MGLKIAEEIKEKLPQKFDVNLFLRIIDKIAVFKVKRIIVSLLNDIEIETIIE